MRRAFCHPLFRRTLHAADVTMYLLVANFVVHVADSKTWYVDVANTSVGKGMTSQPAFVSIQEAIDTAEEGDTVIVSPGTYTENISFYGKNIVLRSNDPLDPTVVADTIIDGNQSGPVVAFFGMEDERCVLSGFTIRNGKAQNGGGICGGSWGDDRTHATIENNIITGNSATGADEGRGGGLFCCEGIVRRNTISENTATYGGGLEFCNGLIQNNIITRNSATHGGGLCHCRGTIQNNIVTQNSVSGFYGCQGVIQNNRITHNSGGGLARCEGTIQYNTVVGNAGTSGGGLYRCEGTIRNCIIWGNTAEGSGSQIYQCDSPFFCCIQGGSGGIGNIDEKPLFVDPGAGDYRLKPESPCIDAGWNYHWLHWPQRDLDGNCRVAGAGVDMGCYEFDSSPDSDGDLLSDSEEAEQQTEPNMEDTDRDGLRDGFEVLRGSDPLAVTYHTIFHVPTDVPTIQAALHLAVTGDEIIVASGTYYENLEFLGHDVILRSSEPENPDVVAATIIDGGGKGSVLRLAGNESETCRISGFTIQNGSRDRGAGIRGGTSENHSRATIENNIITGNYAPDRGGGGIAYCDGIIRKNTISGNTGSPGGGLWDCDGTIEDNVISGNLTSVSIGGGLAQCDGLIQRNQIIDNWAYSGGGLVFCNGTIQENVISENIAEAGDAGGGGLLECNGTILNNVISGNAAIGVHAKAGGLCRCNGAIQGNTISLNSAPWGGGLAGCEAMIRENTISANTAGEDGGGLHDCSGTIQLNVITGNTAAGSGGGLCECRGTLRNNVITLNLAGNDGGGLCECSASILNNVIALNSAGNFGGGLYDCDSDVWNNTIFGNSAKESGGLWGCNGTIKNCILWGNDAAGFPQIDFSSSIPTYSCIEGWARGGDGNFKYCPYFVDASNGDYHLEAHSPCIDAGYPASLFAQEPQPNGGRINLGAHGNTSEATSKSADTDQDQLPDDWESEFFKDLSQAAGDDPDGDQITNLEEYYRGLDPNVQDVQAASWYVDGSVPDSGEGASWETAFKTIQEGINAATDGDVVTVAPGLYVENTRFEGKSITLTSTDPNDPDVVSATMIDGNQEDAVVTFSGTEDESCVIRGFTIQNGMAANGGGIYGGWESAPLATIENNIIQGNSASGSGGGIYFCYGAIRDNTIRENTAYNGGGIHSCDGTIDGNTVTHNSASRYGGGVSACDGMVTGNTISENTANIGGGLDGCHGTIEANVISGNSTVGDYGEGGGLHHCYGTIRNNTFSGNTAGEGGAIHDCQGLIEDNVITGNSASYGGAISDTSGPIRGNTISGNSAHQGGGLRACEGTVEKNVISGNSVSDEGGGLCRCDGTIRNNLIINNQAQSGGGLSSCRGTLENNTIANNSANQDAGAMLSCDGVIRNCIIWGNASSSGYEVYGCASPTYSCVEDGGSAGEGSFDYYPYFVDPGGGDYHLMSRSPCIDAGDPTFPFVEEPYPNGGRINMGAYGNTSGAASKSPDSDGDALPDDWETDFFGDLAQDGSGDPDGDSLTNSQEYHRGLDPTVAGACWYVDASVAMSGDGQSWETAFGSIQEGIEAASDGDTILVAQGVYVENIHFDGKNVRLASTDPQDSEVVAKTVIDGNRSGPVVSFFGTENETCLLAGFTIRNGQAEYGAGIQGASWEDHTHATIRYNVIVDNVALGNYSSGGGLASCDGTIENNIIARNAPTGQYAGGGGLANCNGLIQNNTIANNRGVTHAGALSRCGGTIRNCIIWGNGSALRAQLYESSEPEFSCIEHWIGAGEGNIINDPCFSDPESGDYRLRSWSPCIDTGDPTSPFANEPEPNGGRVNMGAYGNTVLAASRSPDTDSDTLPDEWEQHWFGDLEEDGEGDPDHDSIINTIESRYGWDPTLPAVNRVNNATQEKWYQTIQATLRESIDGDQIVVQPGVYWENIGFIGKNVVLRGTDPADDAIVAATIIDGSQAGPVVTFDGNETSNCELSGFTIRNGSGTYGGGGICGRGTFATIDRNVISGNYAWYEGGGVWDCDGLIQNNQILLNRTDQSYGAGLALCDGTIQENVIAENNGRSGGGLAHCHGLVRDNIIRANSARDVGGGLRECNGEIVRNVILGNRASRDGGGLARCEGLIQSNVISRNWAHGAGGGVWNSSGTVENNLIAENHGNSYGGGSAQCSGTIQNNTVVFNTSIYGCGGIYGCTGTILNCIVWGNREGDSDATQIEECSAPTYCCIQNWKGGGEGNIRLDPLFVSSAYGNYHLWTGSPCIDAGTVPPSSLPENDIDGEPRLSGPKTDIGADEYVDSDQDGLPDYWEMNYFSSLTSGLEDDPDDDGLTNLEELLVATNPANWDTDADGSSDKDEPLAGTDPLYPESLFQVADMEFDGAGIELTWPAYPGKTYQVYCSIDLRTWWRLDEPITATLWDATLSFEDPGAHDLKRCFYVVRILPIRTPRGDR